MTKESLNGYGNGSPIVEAQGPTFQTCESCHTRIAVGVASDNTRGYMIHVCERCRPDDTTLGFTLYEGYCPVCLTPHGGPSCR